MLDVDGARAACVSILTTPKSSVVEGTVVFGRVSFEQEVPDSKSDRPANEKGDQLKHSFCQECVSP